MLLIFLKGFTFLEVALIYSSSWQLCIVLEIPRVSIFCSCLWKDLKWRPPSGLSRFHINLACLKLYHLLFYLNNSCFVEAIVVWLWTKKLVFLFFSQQNLAFTVSVIWNCRYSTVLGHFVTQNVPKQYYNDSFILHWLYKQHNVNLILDEKLVCFAVQRWQHWTDNLVLQCVLMIDWDWGTYYSLISLVYFLSYKCQYWDKIYYNE